MDFKAIIPAMIGCVLALVVFELVVKKLVVKSFEIEEN